MQSAFIISRIIVKKPSMHSGSKNLVWLNSEIISVQLCVQH